MPRDRGMRAEGRVGQAWKAAVAASIALALSVFSTGSSQAQTAYNGDRLDGVPVIERLDLSDLPPGQHRFYFRAGDLSVGQSIYVPVMVAKGVSDGPRLLLNAAVHGDELNGIRVVQRVMADLEPTKLRGAVIGTPGVNISGMINNSRYYHLSNDGGYTEDLNRIMPGDENSGNAAKRLAGKVWNRLYQGNVDQVVDLHTQTRGTEYPMFVFADYRNPQVREMAELLQPDMIKIDKGAKGTVETSFVEAGIPAVTYEIGSPKVWQSAYIERAVHGIGNLMIHLGMKDGDIVKTSVETFVGNEYTTVRAEVGGFTDVLVSLGEAVESGQKVAVQMNAFGDVLKEYTAPFAGRVLSLSTDPLREPGATLVRVLRMNDDPDCKEGC